MYGMSERQQELFEQAKAKKKKLIIGGSVIGVVIILAFTLFSMFTEDIKTGHVGLIYSKNGGLQDGYKGEGTRLVYPWQNATQYTIAQENVRVQPISIPTKDGKNLSVEFEYNYNFNVEKLSEVFRKFRGQDPDVIQSGYVKGRLSEHARQVTSQYSVIEVFENRTKIATEISQRFINEMKDMGINVDSFTMGSPTTDEQTATAINEKVLRSQKLEAEKVDLDRAKLKADTLREEAKGVADKAKIEAEGQSKANELLRQSMTPELVQYEAIKKWDGKTPNVTGGGNMIQIPVPQK